MYISFNWLKEYLDLKDKELDPYDVALQLSLKGANVEGTEEKDGDFIYDIENKSITHRPDLFCHYGIAREVSTIYRVPLVKIQDTRYKKDTNSKSQEESQNQVVIKNEAPEMCNRYTGTLIENIEVKESPDWLKQKLEILGEKSINNIVDLTNFVQFEVGQPLHAFDTKKITNEKTGKPEIIVRRAEKGERLVTLDNKELELTEDDLVIADAEKSVALAGVKGGKETEVNEQTTSIVLEAANFDGPSVRKTSVRHTLRTEASLRLEKRLDSNLCDKAANRFVELLAKAGCENYKVFSYEDVYTNERKSYEVEVDLKRLPVVAGDNIKREDAKDVLNRLGLEVKDLEKEGKITIQIPTWRHDVKTEDDVFEEIIRVYGFENIRPKPFKGDVIPAKWPKELDYYNTLEDKLVGLGYDEVWTHIFTSEKTVMKTGLDPNNHIRVSNALSREVELMKTSLVPEMMNVIKLNQGNFDAFQVYTLDKVYLVDSEKRSVDSVEENRNLCFINYSKNQKNKSPLESLFLETKSDLLNIFKDLKNDIKLVNVTDYPPYFERSETLAIEFDGKLIGHAGRLSEEVKTNYKIIGNAVIVEIDLTPIKEYINEKDLKKIKFVPINTLPKIERDLSFWVDKKVSWGEIQNIVNSIDLDILRSVELFDIFDKSKERNDEKSVAIRLTLQADDRTLKDKEADDVVKKVIDVLNAKFKIELRDQ